MRYQRTSADSVRFAFPSGAEITFRRVDGKVEETSRSEYAERLRRQEIAAAHRVAIVELLEPADAAH